MEPANPNYVEVYRAKNVAQAQVIHLALEEAGIPSEIDDELLSGAAGGLPIGWVTAPRIMVEKAHAPMARAIIDELDREESGEADEDEADVTRCLSCGAAMPEGNPKCPRCGWSYEGN